jgi:hypothetical protein
MLFPTNGRGYGVIPIYVIELAPKLSLFFLTKYIFYIFAVEILDGKPETIICV